MTRFDDALDLFLRAEQQYQKEKSPENERVYGQAKYALFVTAKELKEALRYYAMGGSDTGKSANLALYGTNLKKDCKTC